MPRPSFITAWAASQRIYDPVNSGARVAKAIGANVEKNACHPFQRPILLRPLLFQ